MGRTEEAVDIAARKGSNVVVDAVKTLPFDIKPKASTRKAPSNVGTLSSLPN